MTPSTDSELIERLLEDAKPSVGAASDWSAEERGDYWASQCIKARQNAKAAATRISSVLAELERLREGWQNAIFALEYWDRECRVAGKSPLWADGPTDRTFTELERFRARTALTQKGPPDG